MKLNIKNKERERGEYAGFYWPCRATKNNLDKLKVEIK